jgi:hypothetical protein
MRRRPVVREGLRQRLARRDQRERDDRRKTAEAHKIAQLTTTPTTRRKTKMMRWGTEAGLSGATALVKRR